jgi:tetratricopeptide (TPR) repeat protein
MMKNPVYKTHLPALAVITACALPVYFAALHSPFFYDDLHAIVQNSYIKNLEEFSQRVGFGNILNRSILLFTFALNYAVGGLDTFGYHLVNLWLHIAVGILLYYSARECVCLDGERQARNGLPLVAALIHTLHPLATEPVVYISSRSSILAALFYLLAFYAFARHLRHAERSPKRWLLLALALVCFVVGTGAKETIVTLPVMALVYLWFRRPQLQAEAGFAGSALWHRGERISLAVTALALIVPAAIYLFYRYSILGHVFVSGADPLTGTYDRSIYLFTQSYVVIFYYLLKLLLPFNLNFEPDVQEVSGFADGRCLAGLAVIAALAYALRRQPSRLMRFGFLWAAVAVLPTSSIVPLKQLAAEHHVYLPGLGICLALAAGLWRGSPAARTVGIGLLAVLALLTAERTLDYRNTIALWSDTAKKSPAKILAHNNLAVALTEAKHFDASRRELALIKQLDPSYANAYANLGHVLALEEKWEAASAEFDRAAVLDSENPVAFYDAGLARIKLHRATEAIPYLQRALALRPDQAEFHFVIGNAYRDLSRNDEALSAYRRTLELDPEHASAHNNSGVIFWRLQSFDLAETEFKKTLELEPKHLEARENLANLYVLIGRFDAAIPLLTDLVEQRPDDANLRNLLTLAQTLRNK